MISIVTPNFNSAKYLPETISSVLLQTYKDWEWIIVDDCSIDNSCEIIQEISDERVKLIKLNKNSGAAIARNVAISIAVGRYITFLDSDDIWNSNFLEFTLNFMKENNYELVFSSYHRKNENLKLAYTDFVVPNKVDFKRLLFNCPIPMLTSIYDTKRIGKIAIPTNAGKREDYAMWLDILRKIPFAYGIREPLATYRIRDNSYSRNKLNMARGQFSIYYNFLGFNPVKSLFFTTFWAINGFLKYRGI